MPDTSFTRTISNPEVVMRRRRQQKLEKKLAEIRSKDDQGGLHIVLWGFNLVFVDERLRAWEKGVVLSPGILFHQFDLIVQFFFHR